MQQNDSLVNGQATSLADKQHWLRALRITTEQELTPELLAPPPVEPTGAGAGGGAGPGGPGGPGGSVRGQLSITRQLSGNMQSSHADPRLEIYASLVCFRVQRKFIHYLHDQKSNRRKDLGHLRTVIRGTVRGTKEMVNPVQCTCISSLWFHAGLADGPGRNLEDPPLLRRHAPGGGGG